MHQFINQLIHEQILKTPQIIGAFQKIDRRDFVQPTDTEEAYGNYPLPIGWGQTISQPLTVAFMLELLQPQGGEKILDVGAGSGWQTALLAQIVGAEGKIYAIERIRELCNFGKANLAKYSFIKKGIVELFCRDGSKGLSEQAPFDKIIVAAAAEKVPEKLKEQLKIGGILVLPVGKYNQSIVKIEKIKPNKFRETKYPGFIFVPLIEG